MHLILLVANHFEPLWNDRPLAEGVRLVDRWCTDVAALGVKDGDGHPFKHTYFFPAEQYHPDLLAPLAEHCEAGFGEVEVHLHHGIEQPDTAAGLERTLRGFVDRLVGHGCLSRDRRTGEVGYAFVHGNWALANSASGRLCGVDNEMEILARTGCYMDCTFPCAPDRPQVGIINSIYQCAGPLHLRAAHRSGVPLRAGAPRLTLPILLQGPLLIDWTRRMGPLPIPRLENGDLGGDFPPTLHRSRLWLRANIHVTGRPDWIFLKLHTHGLIERHVDTLLGDPMRRFLETLVAHYNDGTRHRLHFATAREAANMIFAAVDGQQGDPHHFRDYRYVPLREASARRPASANGRP